MWLPWPYAMLGAIALSLCWVVVRPAPHPTSDPTSDPTTRLRATVAPFAGEIALVLVLYSLWRIAGQLSVLHTDGAEQRGLDLWRLERALHLPSELAIQRAVLPHPWIVQAANVYYAVVHVPALIAMLVWLFVRHRDRYPGVRDTLALLTGACLLIQLVPVMPPRFMPSLGFVDTGHLYGQSVYTQLGRGASDQLSAMPSVHVGWAVLVGLVVVTASTSRWRWLVLAHPIATAAVVVVTANHWWLDGVVAVGLLGAAMAIDVLFRRAWLRRAWSRRTWAPVPVEPAVEPAFEPAVEPAFEPAVEPLPVPALVTDPLMSKT